jgi:hypothetical protein
LAILAFLGISQTTGLDGFCLPRLLIYIVVLRWLGFDFPITAITAINGQSFTGHTYSPEDEEQKNTATGQWNGGWPEMLSFMRLRVTPIAVAGCYWPAVNWGLRQRHTQPETDAKYRRNAFFSQEKSTKSPARNRTMSPPPGLVMLQHGR